MMYLLCLFLLFGNARGLRFVQQRGNLEKTIEMPPRFEHIGVDEQFELGVDLQGSVWSRNSSNASDWYRISESSEVVINKLAVGDGKIIGLDGVGQIWLRTGNTTSEPLGTGWEKQDGSCSVIAVGEGKIVCVTSTGGTPLERTGISLSKPFGTAWRSVHWQAVSNWYGDTGFLHISVGCNRMFAVTGKGVPVFRDDNNKADARWYAFPTNTSEWVPYHIPMVQIEASRQPYFGCHMWALDNQGYIYVRNGTGFIGSGWGIPLAGDVSLRQVAAGGGTKEIAVSKNTLTQLKVGGEITHDTVSGMWAVGDPHLVNVLGERFDVRKLGEHVLLQVPRNAAPADAMLRIVGSIESFDMARCSREMWIRHLTVSGNWIGIEPVTFDTQNGDFNSPETVSMSQGGVSLSPEQFVANNPSFHCYAETKENVSAAPTVLLHRAISRKLTLNLNEVELNVEWATSLLKRGLMNYLDLQVLHLGEAMSEIGGLLGVDSHEHASTADDSCRSLMSHVESDPLLGSVLGASLD